jgi:class 3 adenylate cyclase
LKNRELNISRPRLIDIGQNRQEYGGWVAGGVRLRHRRRDLRNRGSGRFRGARQHQAPGGLVFGDITHDEEDNFGDGVNIAARLQEIAEPASIVISDMARRSIDGKLAAIFVDLGAQNLKNIAEPVTAYGWRRPCSAPL